MSAKSTFWDFEKEAVNWSAPLRWGAGLLGMGGRAARTVGQEAPAIARGVGAEARPAAQAARASYPVAQGFRPAS